MTTSPCGCTLACGTFRAGRRPSRFCRCCAPQPSLQYVGMAEHVERASVCMVQTSSRYLSSQCMHRASIRKRPGRATIDRDWLLPSSSCLTADFNLGWASSLSAQRSPNATSSILMHSSQPLFLFVGKVYLSAESRSRGPHARKALACPSACTI